MIAFRSPVLRPLHPKEWVRPAGSIDFRVTQQFDDLDFYNQSIPGAEKKYHRATDIGNTRCDGAVVAMAPGRAYRLRDNASAVPPPPGELPWTDALGVRIDHGQGLTSEYWHLNAYAIGSDGVQVQAGQQIGTVGKTGLLRVCHLHVEMKVNGQRIDPEPHMFGAPWPLLIPDTSAPEDDDVTWLPYFRFTGPNTVTVRAGATLYDTPSKDRPRFTLPGNRNFASAALVEYPDNKGLYHVITNPDAPGAFFAANSDVVVRTPILMPGPIDLRLDVARDGVAKIEVAANKLVEALR